MRHEGNTIPQVIDEVLKYRQRIIELEAVLSESKEREEELRKSEKRYRMIFEHSPLGITHFDKTGVIVDCNQRLAEIVGAPREKIIGFNVENDLNEIARLAVRRALQGKVGYFEGDYLSNTGGKLKTLRIISTAILSSDGEMIGGMSICEDISERRRIEELLRKRQDEMEVKSKSLEEANTALKVLLKMRDQDREDIEQRVVSNVKQLIEPYLEALRGTRLTKTQEINLEVVEANLRAIVSPFLRQLSPINASLSPAEIEIANLIKIGRRTKEIAELSNISLETVKTHRKNLRRKLGLINTGENLWVFLSTLCGRRQNTTGLPVDE